MYKILQATYQNGHLVLNEKLSSEMEGRNLKLIILDTDSPQAKKEQFFRFIDTQAFALPEDYQFNREELYDR